MVNYIIVFGLKPCLLLRCYVDVIYTKKTSVETDSLVWVVSFYGSCPFYYSLSVLEQSVELLSEVAFCDGTYVLVNELTTLEEEDCGDVADAILDGYVVVSLYVALAYNDLAVVLLSEL